MGKLTPVNLDRLQGEVEAELTLLEALVMKRLGKAWEGNDVIGYVRETRPRIRKLFDRRRP